MVTRQAVGHTGEVIVRGATRTLAALVATVTIVAGCVAESGSTAPSESSPAIAVVTSSPFATCDCHGGPGLAESESVAIPVSIVVTE